MPIPDIWDYTDPAMTPPDPDHWGEADIPLEYQQHPHCPACGAFAHTDPAKCDEAYAPRRYQEDA